MGKSLESKVMSGSESKAGKSGFLATCRQWYESYKPKIHQCESYLSLAGQCSHVRLPFNPSAILAELNPVNSKTVSNDSVLNLEYCFSVVPVFTHP